MLCTPQKNHCEILLSSEHFFVIPRMIRGCGWALLGYLRPRVAALAGRWPWPWRALPACEPAPIVALIRQSPTVQNHYVGGQKGPWQVLCVIKSSFRIWKCIMHIIIFAPHHTIFSWILEDSLGKLSWEANDYFDLNFRDTLWKNRRLRYDLFTTSQ